MAFGTNVYGTDVLGQGSISLNDRVSMSLSVSWGIHNEVSNAFDISYSISNTISNTFDISWEIHEPLIQVISSTSVKLTGASLTHNLCR